MLFIEKTLNLVQYSGLNITYNTSVIQMAAQWDIIVFNKKPSEKSKFIFLLRQMYFSGHKCFRFEACCEARALMKAWVTRIIHYLVKTVMIISITRSGLLKSCEMLIIERSEIRKKQHDFKSVHFECRMVLFYMIYEKNRL